MITGTVFNVLGLNGSVFSQQPSEHGWDVREEIGIDGNGIAIYPAVRQYNMKWDLIDTDVWNEMYAFFLAQNVTGTVVATLPKFNTTPYQFYNYSGCVIRELTYENWFQNYYTNVKLLIVRIRT